MSTRSHLVAVVLCAALCGLPVAAVAATGATLVVLVTTDPGAEVTHRVEEQLEALGFEVIVLNAPATGSAGPAALQQAARNVGAIAALRVVPLAQTVQVWVADPVTGKEVSRELVPPPGQSPSDAAVALGAVELLRASLLELHPPEPPAPRLPPPPPPSCPPPPPPATAPPTFPRVGIAIGAGADLSISGGPSVDADAAVWIGLGGRWGVRGLASITATQGRATGGSAGDVAVSSELYGLEGSFDLARDRASIPVVGIGIAGVQVTARGIPAAGNIGVYTSTWAASPFLHLGESWAIVPSLRVRGDVLAGWSFAPPQICVADATTGQCSYQITPWGAPLVKLSVGIEALWWGP